MSHYVLHHRNEDDSAHKKMKWRGEGNCRQAMESESLLLLVSHRKELLCLDSSWSDGGKNKTKVSSKTTLGQDSLDSYANRLIWIK